MVYMYERSPSPQNPSFGRLAGAGVVVLASKKDGDSPLSNKNDITVLRVVWVIMPCFEGQLASKS